MYYPRIKLLKSNWMLATIKIYLTTSISNELAMR